MPGLCEPFTILVVLEATRVERRLVEAVQAGELLDVTGERERDVRAVVIRGLLCGRFVEEVDPRGVRLRGARVVGMLDLSDVRTSVPLVLDGCTHEERIVLTRAHLPHLDLSHGVFPALEAGDLVCEHDVRLRGIRGEWLNLVAADVAGQLSLHGAQLQAVDCPAVNAERLKVGNGLFLTGIFQARSSSTRGTVCLLGASVVGPFEVDGARLEAAYGPALNADWLTVHGSVFFNEGFTAESDCERGTLRLQGAEITGQLNLNGASVLNSADAGAGLVLISARVGSDLVMPLHALAAAGSSGSLLVNVNGLHYPRVPRGATYQEWLVLLAHHTPSYAAQPYQQLAAVHRAAGHDQEARQILVAQQRDLRRRGDLGGRGRMFLHAVSGVFIGYGHRPFRALGFLAGVCALAGVVVVVASVCGVAVQPGSRGSSCSAGEGFGLAVDTAVPVLKAGGGKRCEIATTTGSGQVLYLASYLLQILGWAFATLFVAGYTGLVRKTS